MINTFTPVAYGSTLSANNMGQVEPKILSALRKEFGAQSPVGSIREQRVQTLKGFFIDGHDLPISDPAKTLGKGWVKMPRDCYNPNCIRFALNPPDGGSQCWQILSFDRERGTTTLSACTMAEQQHITMDASGKISSEKTY